MPEYQYRCEGACGDFLMRHSIHHDPDVWCPKCGVTAYRLPAVPAVIFKGQGWAGKE